MYEKQFVGLDLTGFQDNGLQQPVSRVTLLVDDEHVITAGDDTGLELLADCPHATQTMADSILAWARGYQYQMFSADDANLDPAAELGDGVTAGTVYSVVSRISSDGSGYAGITAPGKEEMEDEYPAAGPMTQAFNRQIAETRSEIAKTSERITLLVSNEVKGLSGRLDLTATNLTTQISNTKEGLESRIEQTASSLASQISNAQGEISELQQTARGLSITATSQAYEIESIWDAMDGFSLSVSNGDESSTLRLMSGRTELSSAEIYFRGMVTYEDLSKSGRTVINGGNITTGTIEADTVSVNNSFQVWYRNKVCGYMGGGEGYDGTRDTVGAMLSDWTQRNYLLATEGGVRMQDSQGGAIWVTGGNCFSSEDMQTYSDRRLKEDIDYDLECYKTFFRALKPCRFLMRNNPSSGYHTGFIAQDVQEAMEAAHLSPMDFAGLAEAGKVDNETVLSLSYGSFAALNTLMVLDHDHAIQNLFEQIKELERRISA